MEVPAEIINKLGISVLFDLSKVSQDEAIQFVTDFSEKIYQLTKTPTHKNGKVVETLHARQPKMSRFCGR